MISGLRMNTTGKILGYEKYHGEITLDKELIGGWDYDKNQKLYIGMLSVVGKRFYAGSVEGLARKVEKFLESQRTR